jgi:hypothetical protein
MTDFHTHKWMYDARSLAAALSRAGFVNAVEMKPFESNIDDIDSVERSDRTENGAGVCVEALKV